MESSLELLRRYGWREWLCHTNFSFLMGASHPHEILQRACQLQYQGLAITDFDGVYGLARGHLDLQKIIKSNNSNPQESKSASALRLFYGMELRLSNDHDLPIIYQNTLALIPQSHRGYHHLCRLSTHAHRLGKSYALVTLDELLREPVDDLVAIQPMRGLMRQSFAHRLTVNDQRSSQLKAWEQRCADLADHFNGRFYFAVSRHLNPSEDYWIRPTLNLARRLGRSCLLSQDVFFHEPNQKDLCDALQAIRTNKTLDQAVTHMFVNHERCLHSLENIAQRFGGLPVYEQALRASAELADSCQFSLSELSYQYPKEMIPEGYTAQSFLENLVWESARQYYGDLLPDRVVQVLTHELKLIATLGFADYFLTVWDIVRWARSRDILCQGRGSAANSAVCFVLGVTPVDPAVFDLLFERFLSVERGDPPDIDVDFEHERREEVIQYIYERYGRSRAAMVANVITFRSRGALRAVGKALGVPELVLGEVARLLETRHFRHMGASAVLEHMQAESSKSQSTPHPLDDENKNISNKTARHVPWKLWGQLAERLRGFPRHLGLHSGGFMLSDKPLDWLVPQEPATKEGRSVVQWCKDDIEGLKFFKIDVLALGMLTAIRKAFQAIEQCYGQRLTLANIPQNDLPTYEMIQKADTVGTFQIESRAQMSMLPRLRPKNLYDLVVEVAIIRPGPIQGGMIHPYLRRRDGLESVSYPDERLRPILERTLGIPIFQEQVMRIAIAVGGFSPGEANDLRRHMGAWSMKGEIGPWLGRLAKGMRDNGLPEEFVQSILNQMRGFADYGFPESHAASFALLAYASSYLKRHYPAAFFMALLNSQPMGFYSPHALLQVAQRDGVKVLPICVNASEWDCTLQPDESERSSRPTYHLRLGLRYVTGLRQSGGDVLVAARRVVGGAFANVSQILACAGLYRPDLTALAAANAFHAFGLERKAAIWLAEAAPFCPTLEDLESTPAFVQSPESRLERIERDFAATPTSLGAHPVEVIRAEHWCYEIAHTHTLRAKVLPEQAEGCLVAAFGMILVRQAPPTARGMVFITLEDETGYINLVFTPQVYAEYYKLIESQSFLCVRGRLQKKNEMHSLMVQRVFAPRLRRADVISLVSLDAPADHQNQAANIMAKELQATRNYM